MRVALTALCAGLLACRTQSGVAATAFLRRDPYVGVSCPQPNSIACDRVGLAVWMRAPAAGVTAEIDGRPLRLHAGGLGGQGPTYWEGYLQPAGPLAGPLKIGPDDGGTWWAGQAPKNARVLLRISRPGGAIDTTRLSVNVSPGWG